METGSKRLSWGKKQSHPVQKREKGGASGQEDEKQNEYHLHHNRGS